MTYKARKVLSDCRKALSMLESETDIQKWRILWAGAVALIRAVGHVLDKVDGSDPLIKKIAKDSFLKWKTEEKHLIFPAFIEKERNTLLKEYNSDVHPLIEVPVLIESHLKRVGDNQEKTVIDDIITLGENIYRPMLEGPWEGADCRDLYKEAIDWWEQQLDFIDLKISQNRQV